MSIFTDIYNVFFPEPIEKKDEPKKPEELEFRVVTHFSGSKYYCLELKTKWGWSKVTHLYRSYSGKYDDLYHPILGHFDEMVKVAKGFKNDPASFEAHKQKQIDIFNKRAADRKARKKSTRRKS